VNLDRNLLFGVLALQADLIDQERFARGCILWSAQKTVPLADLLVQQGWLTNDDKADVEKLVERKVSKHKGDARAGLAEVTTDPIKRSLAGVDDSAVRQTLAELGSLPQGMVLLSTTDYEPVKGERWSGEGE
jgi:hypothetical protein